MKHPVRVAVTGAAGQIGYSLLFRIASGEMLGNDQPVILQLLEIPDEKVQKALRGVMMELDDCAFPLLHGMIPASDPMIAAPRFWTVGMKVFSSQAWSLISGQTGLPSVSARNRSGYCVAE